jgi:aminopeptidase N
MQMNEVGDVTQTGSSSPSPLARRRGEFGGQYWVKTCIISFCLLSACPFKPPSQQIDLSERPLRVERSHDFDIKHYRIELQLDDARKALTGVATITLAPLLEGLERCSLDAETFTVDSVSDGAGRRLRFSHQDGDLIIDLAEQPPFGKNFTLKVNYHGERIDVDSEAHGMSADYDLGLDFKEPTEDNPQLINTLSFPEGARHWFPCYDHPNDRATQEVIATVSQEYRVLSNGRLVSQSADPQAGTRTFHWSQELPHPTYLFVLVAGPYEIIEDSLGDLPINYWVYRKDVEDAMRSFHKTPEIIEFFNNTYGYRYPWIKYDQITIPGIGGGAESTSATVLAQSTIHDAKADKDFPSHDLVAHEAAHQWWGNLVSYRDWSETWLSESFATYGEYLFSRHDLGDEEGAVNLLNNKDAYLQEAKNRYIRPIVYRHWRYPNDNFDSHTYPKGAVILHHLRFVLGDRAFFQSLKHFLHEHAFQPVQTEQLIIAIKEATGQNLEWFFDQWIYSPGHPVFEISYDWQADSKKVHLRVRQTQDTQRGIPIYRAPVIVGWRTASGQWQKKIWIDEPDEAFIFDVPEKPLLVRFDQGNFLLKEWSFEKTTEELLYQLANDDVIGRAWAASQLADNEPAPNIEAALLRSATKDSFWSVRRAALAALQPIQGAEITESFKRIATGDPHSRVRSEALTGLGQLAEPALLDFFTQRFESEDSYRAQAESVRAIGRLGGQQTRGFLEQAAAVKSPRDIIGRAARAALAEMDKK